MLKITLDNKAILEAITDYVAKQGIAISDKQVTIKLRSGRKDNGSSADVTISDEITTSSDAPEQQAETEKVTTETNSSLFPEKDED